MQEFEIIFYEDGNGNKPVEDFILNLDNKMRAKMLLSIRVIKEKGPQTRLPFSEELEDGIFELRAKSGSNISRVLYFFVVGRRIVLTNGFIKKTQKTPRSEIEKAKRYRIDFLSREESGNER
jgi:phage-related protein